VITRYVLSASELASATLLTFCHEDFHEVWFAVNVTLHAREVSQAAQENTTALHELLIKATRIVFSRLGDCKNTPKIYNTTPCHTKICYIEKCLADAKQLTSSQLSLSHGKTTEK